MISDFPKPWLFIHIPKTAGTSIENALSKAITGASGTGELSSEQLTKHALPGGWRHGPVCSRPGVISEVIQHESVRYFEERGDLDGRYVFTVVRNPYDRALSELIYLQRTSPRARQIFCGPTWTDDLKKLADFDGYISHDLGACQIDWLMDSSGRNCCDRIMRFESLRHDWQSLCSELGIGANLAHAMNSKRRFAWWDYYDDEALEKIGKKYERDFKELNYPQGKPDPGSLTNHENDPVLELSGDAGFRIHHRLELPDQSIKRIEADGIWETLDPAKAARVAQDCFRTLQPGGVLRVNTLDLGAAEGLLRSESAESISYVQTYLDRNFPEAPLYAPALVINHWVKNHTFVYDEGLLIETLAEGGFSHFTRSDHCVGKMMITAKKSEAIA